MVFTEKLTYSFKKYLLSTYWYPVLLEGNKITDRNKYNILKIYYEQFKHKFLLLLLSKGKHFFYICQLFT